MTLTHRTIDQLKRLLKRIPGTNFFSDHTAGLPFTGSINPRLDPKNYDAGKIDQIGEGETDAAEKPARMTTHRHDQSPKRRQYKREYEPGWDKRTPHYSENEPNSGGQTGNFSETDRDYDQQLDPNAENHMDQGEEIARKKASDNRSTPSRNRTEDSPLVDSSKEISNAHFFDHSPPLSGPVEGGCRQKYAPQKMARCDQLPAGSGIFLVPQGRR